MRRILERGLVALLALWCVRASGELPPAAPGPTSAGAPPHVVTDASRAAPERLAPGKSRTSVEGCLAVEGEAAGSRFPAPPRTRTAPRSPVTIAPVPGGILVTHELAHACCLRSDVKTATKKRTVVVTERLHGSPCRCMCSSTLRTSVGLSPGRWTVNVEVDRGQGLQPVHSEAVAVAP